MKKLDPDAVQDSGFCEQHGNKLPCKKCRGDNQPKRAAMEAVGVSIESPESGTEAFIHQFDQAMLEAVHGLPEELAEHFDGIDAEQINEQASEIISQLEQETDPEKRSELQTQLIQTFITLTSNVQGSGMYAFTPSLAREMKELDCSLSAWCLREKLAQSNQDDVQFQFGYPSDHAVGIVTIADGRTLYVDAQNGSIAEVDLEEVSNNGPKTAYPIFSITESTILTQPARPNGIMHVPQYLGIRQDGALHTLGNMHMLKNKEAPTYNTQTGESFRASLNNDAAEWEKFKRMVDDVAGGEVIQEWLERREQEAQGPEWTRPDLAEEMGELEGAAEALGVELKTLIEVFNDAQLEILNRADWASLRNGDSRDETWTLDEVVSWIRQRNNLQEDADRDVQRVIDGCEKGDSIPAPIVIFKEGDDPFLVAGNTRLLVARAKKLIPKVLVLRIK